MTKLGDKDRQISRLTDSLEQVGLKIERTQTSVEVESRENVLLREQIAELSSRLDEVMSERMELAKIVESLKIDCDDFRNQREQALNEVSDLRVSLATAQKINGQMKAQMVSLHEEIKGFKTQYEVNVISREERIAELEGRISDLTKQLGVKEDVTKSALADVGLLRKTRTAQDLERERLERVIETQQRQLDDARSKIEETSDSMAKLDQRYNDVAAALSVYQKRQSTVEQASPTAPPPPPPLLGTPLTAPPPFAGTQNKIGLTAEEENLTPENIEEMIMDYKLGLRSQIG
jgi:chromosome segregation ATPase